MHSKDNIHQGPPSSLSPRILGKGGFSWVGNYSNDSRSFQKTDLEEDQGAC